jgi:hypothetical protein
MYTFRASWRPLQTCPAASLMRGNPCQTGHMALHSRTRAPNPYRQAVQIAYNLGVPKVILDGAFEPAVTHAALCAVRRQWRGPGSQQV